MSDDELSDGNGAAKVPERSDGQLSEALIAAYVRGDLSPRQRAQVDAALDRQPEWLGVVAVMAGELSGPSLEGTDPPDGSTVDRIEHQHAARLQPGDTLGRYRVERPLGHGGMGVVYLAHDPELGRSIALKLLRRTDPDGQARLVREARALAKLNDPRVITVHDVGTWRGRVFLAMERLQGQTLCGWRAAEPRTWREVVEVFVAAGQGLAAAHAAAIVHRDFKPSNVMITDSGRVVVLDFGLAQDVGQPSDLPTTAERPEPPTDTSSLTHTGQALGTPAYMAPEQRRGEPVDHRSDQFSFCLALYQALFGTRPPEAPLPGPSGPATPARGRLPRGLSKVVRRGLADDPEHRHDSMDALVDALAAMVRPRRRWVALAATTGVLGAAITWLAIGDTNDGPQPCQGSAATLAQTWNDERAQAVRDAIERSGRAWSPRVRDEVDTLLTRYGEQWIEEHQAACQAARIDGVDTEAMLELRMGCLDRRRRSLHAMVDVLSDADVEAAAKAVDAAQSLPPIASCRDIERLSAPVRPPTDAAGRAEAEALFDRLAQVEAERQAQHLDKALELASDAVERAAVLDHPPTEADARLALAWVQLGRGDNEAAELQLRAALRAAEVGHHDEATALAWDRLAWVVGYKMARFDEGRQLITRADTWSERLGRPIERELSRLRSAGWIEYEAGDYETSLKHFEAAVELAKSIPRTDPIADAEIGLNLNGRGAAALAAADLDLASRSFARAAKLMEDHLGANHPDVALVRNNLASLLRAQGKLDKAKDIFVTNLEVFVETHSPDHMLVGQTLINLAVIEMDRGASDSAGRYAQRAVTAMEAAYPADHPMVAKAYNIRGDARVALGQAEAAIEDFERALKIQLPSLGADHPSIGILHSNLGLAHHDLGQLDKAAEYQTRAIELLEATLGADHPNLSVVLVSLGITRRDQGQLEQAAALFERAAEQGDATSRPNALIHVGKVQHRRGETIAAVATLEQAIGLLQKVDQDPGFIGDAWFALADARWDLGPSSRDQARDAAASAIAAYSQTGNDAESVADVRTWLAAHGGAAAAP